MLTHSHIPHSLTRARTHALTHTHTFSLTHSHGSRYRKTIYSDVMATCGTSGGSTSL